MTKRDLKALGWAYGRLERELGAGYDAGGVKYAQAAMRPLSGFATIHRAAMMKHKITDRIAGDLAAVLEAVNISAAGDAGQEPVQALSAQGVWQVACMRGRSGAAVE